MKNTNRHTGEHNEPEQVDPRDQREHAAETELEGELRALSGPKPPASVWESVEGRIDVKRTPYWIPFAAAAILLVGLTVLFVGLFGTGRPDPTTTPPLRTIPAALLPGEDASDEVSLVRITMVMSTDPEKLLDYLDSRSRPLRGNEKALSLLSALNGA